MQAHLPTEMSFYTILSITVYISTTNACILEGSELTSQPANASTSAKATPDITSDFWALYISSLHNN